MPELGICTKAEMSLLIKQAVRKVDIIEYIKIHDIDVDSVGHEGSTLLWVAAQDGQLEVAKALILHGADINHQDAEGRTPLYIASKMGHLNIVELLIDNNANIKISSKFNISPLYRERVDYLFLKSSTLKNLVSLIKACQEKKLLKRT